MKSAPFDYVAPSTLDGVLSALSEREDARVLAGGQSLVPLMAFRLADPAVLVDLRRVGDLRGWSAADGGVLVGAMVTQSVAETLPGIHPLVSEAIPLVAHPRTRPYLPSEPWSMRSAPRTGPSCTSFACTSPTDRMRICPVEPNWRRGIGWYGTGMEEHLRELQANTLVICGCNFPNCPRATIYEASERDFRIVLVPDATSGVYPQGLAELTGIGVAIWDSSKCATWVSRAISPAGRPD